MRIKVGFGFDVHQLKDNHPFIVGGVNLEHHRGALGIRMQMYFYTPFVMLCLVLQI